MSTPFWAGVWALVCQATFTPCPSANGSCLYTVLNRGAFHPAASMTGLGNDFAHVGIGSPNITNLVAQVAGPPTISGISSSGGPVTGGTKVTINGYAFIGVSSVLFGTLPAS